MYISYHDTSVLPTFIEFNKLFFILLMKHLIIFIPTYYKGLRTIKLTVSIVHLCDSLPYRQKIINI